MEQFNCVQVPSLAVEALFTWNVTWVQHLKPMVDENLLIAGQKEKELTIEQGNYHNGVPAITVVVDAGWSKHSQKHSYIADSGVWMIFGQQLIKAFLFIGVRNKYCAVAMCH